MLKEILGDGFPRPGHRPTDEARRPPRRPLLAEKLRAGDSLLLEPRSGTSTKIPKAGSRARRGGPRHRLPRHRWSLLADLEIRDAVELPFLRRPVPRAQARPPKGILLYGPPAAARRSSPRPSPTRWPRRSPRRTAAGSRSFFQHQGPRAAQQVRRRDRAPDPAGVPAGAREGEEGMPVIVFFDEMDSLFRTVAPASPATSRTRSSRSCSPRSTASRGLAQRHRDRCLEPRDLIDPAILRPAVST